MDADDSKFEFFGTSGRIATIAIDLPVIQEKILPHAWLASSE
jgi:hypothetical protein